MSACACVRVHACACACVRVCISVYTSTFDLYYNNSIVLYCTCIIVYSVFLGNIFRGDKPLFREIEGGIGWS